MEVQFQLKQFFLIIFIVICITQRAIGQKKIECNLNNTCLSDGSCECDSGYSKTSCGKNIFCSKSWTPPSNWPSADQPIIYRDFENTNCLKLVNGAHIVPGKISNAVSTDHKLKQWVDLGSLADACITDPKTCGSDGASLSMWLKIVHCEIFNTIITTSSTTSGGFIFVCGFNTITYLVDDKSGIFDVYTVQSTEWSHLVLNYFGPNEGEGINVYINGILRKSDTTRDASSNPTGNGHVTIGTQVTNENPDLYYASIKVDELTFWNHTLSSKEVQAIYNLHA